jgi:type I restriction enzyme M protein
MTRITQQNLESYLWGAAVLLRGTIDAGDYKQFIFPLLFYKRLCDVFDEETVTALRESGGDQDFALFPENHRFQVPADAHWREIRKVSRDVGRGLQQAMRAIETANPDKLFGIFGDAQWTNKDRLSDAMLRDLIEHFSTLELTVANLPEDELGQGYEYLIKKFADDSGHTAAEFYTNRTVVHLMTEMLDVQPGESVYDPTCGSGGMLLSCIAHLRNQKKEWRNVKLYGQERNLMTSSIARMNCFLHGIEDFRIERGDTLAKPKLVEGDRLQRFDVVLANPPYSIKQWNREAFAADPWGRNVFGVPPQGIADYAFQQHILQSLKPKTGRCAVLWPHGVLFRDAEDDMRRKMIEADLIECIVGLGPNLFYNSSMPSCIVICRTAKPKARKGKILLINAVNEVTRERAQSFLTNEHLSRIVDAYRDFKGEDHFARVVTIEEVRKNHGNLNLQFYIAPATSAPSSSTSREQALTEAIANCIASSAQVADALAGLTGACIKPPKERTLQIGNTKHLLDGRESWKRVRLGDLLEKTEAVERDPLAAGFERYLMVEHMDANSLRIQRWGRIADDNIPPTFYKVFRKGQILYPTRNPHLRRAAVAGFDGICGEKTLTLSVREGFDARFVPWVFQSESFIEFATNRKIGSTNPHVRWRDVAEFEFDLPSLDQQRRIAEILWGVGGVLIGYEQLVHSIGLDIAGKRHRFFSGKSSFRTQKVGELFDVQLGKMLSQKARTGEGSFRYLGNKNVQWGSFDFSGMLEMDFSPDERRKFSLRDGDLLVCEGGEVGRSAIWRSDFGECYYQKAIHRLRPLSDAITTPYMLEFMYWANEKGLFSSLTGHSTIAHLPVVKLKSIQVPVASAERQRAFVDEMKRARDGLAASKHHTDCMRNVLKSFLTTIIP